MKPQLSLSSAVAVALLTAIACGRQDSKSVAVSASPSETNTIALANTAFGLDLYSRLREEPGNLFFSPYSLSTCLSLAAAGTCGETEREIRAVLHFPGPRYRPHGEIASLLRQLQEAGGSSGSELNLATGIWFSKGLTLLPQYIQVCTNVFAAGLFPTDFTSPPGAALAAINTWIAQRTRGLITNALSADMLHEQTALGLVSAVQFDGKWLEPFWKQATQLGRFHLKPGKEKEVTMMFKEDRPNYMEDALCQAVDLDFRGGHLSMLVMLPRAKDGLPGLEAALAPAYVAEVISKLAVPAEEIGVSLPRFQLTWAREMRPLLQKMGMRRAFEGGSADFSGIAGATGLFADALRHTAVFRVDETGAQSAAAEALMQSLGIVEHSFIANHPFVFFVRHKPSGTILFVGRVVDPT